MKSRIDLAEYFNLLGFVKGAEIGVADGRYSEILCKKIPKLELLCIDPWIPYKGCWRSKGYQAKAYEKAQQRLGKYNTKLIKKTSLEASLDVPDESLDFVFIDGSHLFDNVMIDIILWTRKVREGGIISGHDYTFFTNSGIIEAVNIYTQLHRIELNIISRDRTNSKEDRQPCWWFVKK